MSVALKYGIDKWKWTDMSGYEPHPKQRWLLEHEERFRVLCAGRRWGKTMSAAKEAESMILLPNTYGWIVSKTYDLAEKVFRQIYQTLIIKFKLPTISKSNSQGKMKLSFPWGSVVEAKSADHPDSLIGEGLDWLVFDEAAKCKSNIWEQYLRPCLADRQGWALFISTPNGDNWFNRLLKKGRSGDRYYASMVSPSWENPYLPKEEIEEARRNCSDLIFRQEWGAEIITAVGKVYKDFDETVHAKANMQIDPRWRHFRSFDFGYTNPFVCLWIALDPSDGVWVYDEYVMTHRTIPEHLKAIEAIEKRHKNEFGRAVKYEFSSADPSGATERAELREGYKDEKNKIVGEIETLVTSSEVKKGLEFVRQLFELSGRFRVDAKCVNFIREHGEYSYPDPTANRNENEDPLKLNDHTCDAFRYFMVNLMGYMGKQTVGVY